MKLYARTIISPRMLVACIAGIFLFDIAFGMLFSMPKNEHGSMSDCPFRLGEESVCSMSQAEHIAKWNQLFTAFFSKNSTFASIIILLTAAVSVITFVYGFDLLFATHTLSPPIAKNASEEKLFNYLVFSYSQGILNSRLYA